MADDTRNEEQKRREEEQRRRQQATGGSQPGQTGQQTGQQGGQPTHHQTEEERQRTSKEAADKSAKDVEARVGLAYEHEEPTPTQAENDAAKLAALGQSGDTGHCRRLPSRPVSLKSSRPDRRSSGRRCPACYSSCCP